MACLMLLLVVKTLGKCKPDLNNDKICGNRLQNPILIVAVLLIWCLGAVFRSCTKAEIHLQSHMLFNWTIGILGSDLRHARMSMNSLHFN